ncbi:MAG: DegQ family serine endoprotease [Deltaproteobacteria bacterium]|nr:DegQ family serine endoprotease [Deltaproteobacteria bacterium]
MFKEKGFGVKALLVVGFFSLLVGIGLTIKLDLAQTTGAQEFWKENGDESVTINPTSFSELARKLTPSVVNISTTQVRKSRPTVPFPEFKTPFEDFFGGEFRDFFGGQQREFKRHNLGSGFIINRDGYILTNNHVIENAEEIVVTLANGKKEYQANVVGKDPKLDLALIKIEASEELPIAVIGDSSRLEIGEWVVAIGNPFGLGGTVTAGIVSAKGRVIGAGPYDNFIQTDASINPGNSGGPLFNMKGEVVGINTAIIASGQGIGFAIPVNMVKDVLLQLKVEGKVTRGWIGVGIQQVTPELAQSFGLKDRKGALISSVNEGDPADRAGVKSGDIITSFDGREIDEMNDLPRIVAVTPPHKTVKVEIVRDGNKKVLTLKVAKKRGDDEVVAATEDVTEDTIGLSVQELSPEIARKLRIKGAKGVFIDSVKQGSPSAMAGLRRGDVISRVNKSEVEGVEDYQRAVKAARKEGLIRFLVYRGGNRFYVAMRLK